VVIGVLFWQQMVKALVQSIGASDLGGTSTCRSALEKELKIRAVHAIEDFAS